MAEQQAATWQVARMELHHAVDTRAAAVRIVLYLQTYKPLHTYTHEYLETLKAYRSIEHAITDIRLQWGCTAGGPLDVDC